MAHPSQPRPTQVFLKLNPDTATLRCTHPPPPISPFLLTQNVSLKNIAGSNIIKLCCLQMATSGKVFNYVLLCPYKMEVL